MWPWLPGRKKVEASSREKRIIINSVWCNTKVVLFKIEEEKKKIFIIDGFLLLL